MPVFRFRSVEEMNQPRWRDPGDPALYRAIEAIWTAGSKMAGARFPAGVYLHRTVDDMAAQTEAWAQENFRAFQARRRA